MTNDQTSIVIKQLGGPGKLKAMLGVTQFVTGDHGVSFGFKGSRKHNSCTIKLTGLDQYCMRISKFSMGAESNVAEFNDIYADMLISLFESTTNLSLRL